MGSDSSSITVLTLFFIVMLSHLVLAKTCVMKGRIYTEKQWFGYLLQKTFERDTAKIQYQFSYPVSECCASLAIYYDDQLKQLNEQMSCWDRIRILPLDNNQIIPLSVGNGTVGCKIYNETGEPLYVCTGERSFRSSGLRTWYMAISRCGSSGSLNMNYFFNVTGYYGQCETDSLADFTVPTIIEKDTYLYVAIALGVMAGMATVIAAIFILLWCFGRRKQKKKNRSVTSSQATMTQDIFYVNPSLSDREQSDSQYSQSTGSSENYYEVIPDRRSYESINLQLSMSGNNSRHNNHNHTTLPKENQSSLPAYIFEDSPPPPYQLPQQLLQATSNQNGHNIANGINPPSLLMVNDQQISAEHPTENGHVGGAHAMPTASHQIPNGYTGGAHSVSGPSHSNTSQHLAVNVGHAVAITGTQGSSGSHAAMNVLCQPLSNGAQHVGNTSFQASFNGAQSNQGTGPRPVRSQPPNSSVIKLLNQAYRIQQFETTA